MGRKSTRSDKSVYQLAREAQGYTREHAAEQIAGMSAERIEKLENGRASVQAEDVLLMAECYKAPELCNHYCMHECAIGREKKLPVEQKPLGQIAIETLNALTALERERDRLLEIVEDGQIRPDEREDFLVIKAALDKMAASVASLRLWLDGQIVQGRLNKADYLPEMEE